MTKIDTLPGIRSQFIETARLHTHVLSCGNQESEPVVFIHGNFSSATYWEESMLKLEDEFHVIAPDIRGYGETDDLVIDAKRGPRVWADDLKALSDTFGDRPAHLIGWSLGGAVIMQFAIDYHELVQSLTLISPVSPFGFGGSKDEKGTPCWADFAGSGGGVVNPEFIQRIKDQDKGTESPNSPRNVINSFYYKPPFQAAREEAFLEAALLECIGDDRYPGDMIASKNWPGMGPGEFGPINATSPKHCDTSGIIEIAQKPPVLWLRGDADQIVSDNSMFDLGTLGQMGFVPEWPGAEVYPPQPMVAQMRYVLDVYQQKGGTYREIVIADTGHSPHIEKCDEVVAAMRELFANTD